MEQNKILKPISKKKISINSNENNLFELYTNNLIEEYFKQQLEFQTGVGEKDLIIGI